VVFNGGGGTDDRIVLTGGTLSDVSFIDVSEVEILTADGVGVNATLGARAAAAGIVQVLGALGQSDDVTVTSGFFNEAGLLVVLNGGVDRINAGGSNARITFREAAGELTATDILTGGRGQLDSLDITAGGSANVDGVTRVETININNSTLATGNPLETTNLDLGTLLANEIDADRLTINFNNAGTGDVLNLAGAAVAANITVTGGAEADTLNTGSGADIINGLGGADVINAGGGADTVNGGAGNDNVSGGAGADTLNGDAGNDMLMGNDGSDVINGGDGNDTINGGLGADRLSGNAGADVFVYASLEDSRSTPTAGEPTDNRDTIVSFTAGEDKIDLTALAGAQAIRYNGSFQTFAEAQAAVGGSQNDGNLDAVLVRDLGGRSILFVDVDNNGQLDGNDLQVVLEGLNGSLTRADFLPAAPVAVVGLDEQFSMHYDAGFTSHHFA
jgi:Ca2+-binding RTX toxin-like protein